MNNQKERSRGYAVLAWLVVPIITFPLEEGWRAFLSPLLSVGVSNTLRTLILFIVLLLIIRFLFSRALPEYKRGGMLVVGLLWVILFVVFDTQYQWILLSRGWLIVLADYNLFIGGLRGLVFLLMLFGPFFLVRTPEGDPDLLSMPIGKMATIGLLPSSLKVAYYRRRGATIGEGVNIGPLSILDCKKIVIGDHVDIGMACIIRANELTIGKYSKMGMLVIIDTHKVLIGEEVTIQEQVYIGGLKTDKSIIEIGDLSMIFAQSVLNPTHQIRIGKRVGIGGSNFLFTHGTWQPILEGFPAAFGPITIEDGVWFPWRVFVLPNVHIGKEATIGAGSVINRDVPERSLAAGVPARVVRTDSEYIKRYTDEEKREILKDILEELAGYLRIEDWTVSETVHERDYSSLTFRTPVGPSSEVDNQVTILYKDSEDAWKQVGGRAFVITLFQLKEETASEILDKGSWWFDLENSTWGGSRSPVSLTINGWLARYGHWMKYTS
jgi:acetyltransferase-like isoleucine patch superfamily enzyme